MNMSIMRDQSVTIAKALAIILMVFGHSGTPEYINDYLVLVRMPLFFFMSGYCFKVSYLHKAKTFFLKRIKGIYWPYVKWSLFFLLTHNMLFRLNIINDQYGFRGKSDSLYSIDDILSKAYSIIFHLSGHDGLLGGFWFLNALFWGSIFFYVVCKFCRYKILGVIILLAAAVMFKYNDNPYIPIIGINSTTLYAAFFIYCGHIYKHYSFTFESRLWYMIPASLIVLTGSLLIHTSMTKCEWYLMLPYAFFAIIGTIMAFGLSKRVADVARGGGLQNIWTI